MNSIEEWRNTKSKRGVELPNWLWKRIDDIEDIERNGCSVVIERMLDAAFRSLDMLRESTGGHY